MGTSFLGQDDGEGDRGDPAERRGMARPFHPDLGGGEGIAIEREQTPGFGALPAVSSPVPASETVLGVRLATCCLELGPGGRETPVDFDPGGNAECFLESEPVRGNAGGRPLVRKQHIKY